MSPPAIASSRTEASLLARLAAMMFLQYFVQGCYAPIVSVYLSDALGFNSWQLGLFGTALAVGPLVAPFIIGQLVDRNFATERVLAVSHLAGGLVMLGLYLQTSADTFWWVVTLGALYSVLYVPTMMLTNSLAFYHLVNRDREFPLVRLVGTIGFVLPAWIVEMVFLRNLSGEALNQGRGIALATAGVAGVLMALYCLALPHTPPTKKDKPEFAPGKVVGLMRYRHFAVLVAAGFLVAMAHKFFFVWNSVYLKDVLRSGGVQGAWEQRISSIGQIAEIVVMALLGALIAKIGYKRTMLVGILAYVLRCLIFAGAWELSASFPVTITIVCLGQTLHGFCFACFLATAFMYVDRTTPKDVRGSAQNLFGTFVLGAGAILGGVVSGAIGTAFNAAPVDSPPAYEWAPIWLAGGSLALGCALFFALMFPAETPEPPTDAEKGDA